MNSKVLLIGGAGYIGTVVIRDLIKKNEKTLNMFNHLKFGNIVIDAEKL